MSRRYLEPVQVRAVPDSRSDPDRLPGYLPPPAQFLWRGRLYVVRSVIAHWVEGGSWWRRLTGSAGAGAGIDGHGASTGASTGDRPVIEPSGERQVWRVEASTGRSSSLGVYDLCCDPVVDQWHLARALD